MTWAEDLLGVKDIVDGSGDVDVALPRRSKLRLTGGVTVSDDPTNGQTVIAVVEAEAGEVGTPADARLLMGGYFDDEVLTNAMGMIDGFCTQFVPDEDDGTAKIDSRPPGATAQVYWPTVDDVPAGTLVLASTGDFPATIKGARGIHEYAAVSIDVYTAKTFVGLEVPVLRNDGVDTSATIAIQNISAVNVTLTHAGSQPDATTAPFKITGSASHVLLPFKQCHATWDVNNTVWVVLT